MNVESNTTTLNGLDRISMTARRRAAVNNAVRNSEIIVSLLIGLVQRLGLRSRDAKAQA
jgi:CHASE1-domain containing sensor protein